MAKPKFTGITRPKYPGVTPVNPESSNPTWQYRIKVKNADGKIVDTKVRKGLDGLPFLTARAAHEARREHEERIRTTSSHNEPESLPEPPRPTLREVYDHYLSTEGKTKAPATIRKQDSMWRIHVEPVFGNRAVSDINIIELDVFLFEIYKEHSYKYTEGFLKFFYLLFGHADRLGYLDFEFYRRSFIDRHSRLKMPQMTDEDYAEEEKGAVCYTDEELKIIEKTIGAEDCNLRMAYLLGLHCGLRIGETFGLRWRDIDFDKNEITIRRQMQYAEDGTFHLCGVKTLKSNRTIPITQFLHDELWFVFSSQVHYKNKLKDGYRDYERIYDEIEKRWLEDDERDFVNRKPNGELLTINSVKYWTKQINEDLKEHYDLVQMVKQTANAGIKYDVDRKTFKYHCLRHTMATRAAQRNMNVYLLMDILGHKKIDTTLKYYINLKDQYTLDYARELLSTLYE